MKGQLSPPLFDLEHRMFAVIRSGGKQHRVVQGDKIRLEKLDVAEGAEIVLTDVLLVEDGETVTIGAPVVAGAKVTLKVLAQDRADKVIIFKRRRRKGFHKKRGHRQPFTQVEVTGISL